MTRIQVAADPFRARVRLAGEVLRPRLLAAGPATARVALVPTGALLLGGDVVEVEVEVGDGAALEIVEPAGTVAYPGPPAEWHVRVRVGYAGVLIWAGLPFVVCEDAEVRRTTVVDLADGGRAVVRDTLVLGRAGERGGSLHQSTAVRLAGAELLVEELDLDPARRAAPGILGEARVVDTLAAYGFRPPSSVASPRERARGGHARLDLAGPGVVERFIGDAAHRADLESRLTRWAAHARADEARRDGGRRDAAPVAAGA